MNGGGFSSSKEFPDEVLRFVRAHPVMYGAVRPLHRRPILLQTEGGGRRLTQLAVDRAQAQDGHYHVLYIGTDDSVVLKVITIYNKDTDTVEEVLLEELQVFQVPATITEIIISSKKQQLYVGSEVGVAQVRLHQCELYGSQCADCCLARDPYCAWDGLTCSRYYPAGVYPKSRRFRRQDVRHGNAVQLCNGLQMDDELRGGAEERLVYGVETNSTLLECTPRSLQARVLWFRQQGDEQHEQPIKLSGDTAKQELQANERVVPTAHGLLILHVRRSDAGMYVCQTAEHGYVHALLRVVLVVLKGERVGAAAAADGDGEKAAACPSGSRPVAAVPGPHSRVWYKEFLQLIGYGDAQRVEEYCERVWCSDKKRKKPKRSYHGRGEQQLSLMLHDNPERGDLSQQGAGQNCFIYFCGGSGRCRNGSGRCRNGSGSGRRRNRSAFQGTGPYLGANPFQGALPFTKKRELFPGLPPASPGSFALPHWTPRGAYLRLSRFGDLNPTPFRSTGGDGGHRPALRNGVRQSLRTD
ncbi:Semaphorin-3E [Merluccius polli]|uniref:Semaphorin-3E n=1 Tax=Merluccius polli TaxID=89951 RepID=A0AA47P3E4_MERPO|nr:Semaphorin-3E [Merluccius polli]